MLQTETSTDLLMPSHDLVHMATVARGRTVSLKKPDLAHGYILVHK